MIFILLLCIFLTTFLLVWSMFRLLFLSENKLKTRLEHYLELNKEKEGPGKVEIKVEVKRFTFIQIMKQKVQSRFLTKDKNTKLEIKIAQAGLPLKPEEYILFQWILTALLGGLCYLFTGHWFFILLGGIIGYQLPKLYLSKKQRKRVSLFNDGLADMITTIVGSLRAGFSFQQALMSVVEEATSPIKDEMDSVLKEMQYGKNIEDALNDLKERMPSEDLDLMIQAILIQRQVGGNLATVLDKIIDTIRDRTKIHRQITTLTAQGRLSGYVIALLPVIVGCLLYLIEPDYIGSLFRNPIGLAMVGGGLISGVIGFTLIKKITTIEV